MRIVVICEGNIPSAYAHSVAVMEMAQGFLSCGNDVSVITYGSLPLLARRLRFGPVQAYYGVSSGIPVDFVYVPDLDFFSSTKGNAAFGRLAAERAVRISPELVYVRGFESACECVKAALPTVVETHTTVYDQPVLKKLYAVAQHPSFLGLVTIHERIMSEHVRRGVPAEKIMVAESGYNSGDFDISDDRFLWRARLRLPVEGRIVMYCGSLRREKGINDILSAARALSPERNVRFVLVGGSHADVAYWTKRAASLGVDNAIFTGFIPHARVAHYLKAADILVMPYSPDVEYRLMDLETTSPLKLFEYMASLRPLVSSRFPTIEKVISSGKSGLLASPGDIGDMVSCVKRLLDDPDEAACIARTAYGAVSGFSWGNRCRKILDRFAALI